MSSFAFLWLLIRLVLSLLLGAQISETILMNILDTKKDYYLTQLSKGHLNITEVCMGLGSYHFKKFSKELKVMILLATFAFFHFDGITEEIFSYSATQEHEENGGTEQRPALPLASSTIDHTLLQLHSTGKWDNFMFKEGVQVLLSFSLIKVVSFKGIYTMHSLIHGWGRDRMSSEDRQRYSLMAYVMLAGSLPGDFDEQPYQFRQILVTHLRANIMHSVMAKKEKVDRYFDDAHETFGRLLSEQGFNSEAEKFQIEALDVRSKNFGEEHPVTISMIYDLASTYIYEFRKICRFREAKNQSSDSNKLASLRTPQYNHCYE